MRRQPLIGVCADCGSERALHARHLCGRCYTTWRRRTKGRWDGPRRKRHPFADQYTRVRPIATPEAQKRFIAWGLLCATEGEFSAWLAIAQTRVRRIALSPVTRRMYCDDADATVCAVLAVQGLCVVANTQREVASRG